jgi:hypothetical protein
VPAGVAAGVVSSCAGAGLRTGVGAAALGLGQPPSSALAQHGAEHGRAFAALRAQRDLEEQAFAVPLHLLGLSVVNRAGVLCQVLHRLTDPSLWQAIEAQDQLLALHLGVHLGAQCLGHLRQGVFKHRRLRPEALVLREIQLEAARFRNAKFFADQPIGLKLHLHWARRELGRQLHLHRQQQLVFVAVVDQRANRQLVRGRPLDRTGLHTVGQAPAQARGQAGVARVLPVGVPMGRVLDV